MSEEFPSTKLWIPIYIADYLADTCRLTTEQHGAYLLLIFDYWRKGALPDDDTVLAQVCRLTPDAWSMHRAVLRGFFTKSEDGLLHQKRIDAEMAKARANRSVSVIRAKKAAKARWRNHAPSITPSNALAVLEQCPSPSPTPLKTKAVLDPSVPNSEAQAVAEIFACYLDKTGRSGKTYTLTAFRKKVGLVRLKECLTSCGGDLTAAVAQLKLAIDGIVRSDWHMGRDPKTGGKTYYEWEKHLLKSEEKVQEWIEAASRTAGSTQRTTTRFVNPADAYNGPEYADAPSNAPAKHKEAA